MNNAAIRDAVQAHCAARQISARAFAQSIGLHPVTLSRICNGHAKPGFAACVKLAGGLGLDRDAFVRDALSGRWGRAESASGEDSPLP